MKNETYFNFKNYSNVLARHIYKNLESSEPPIVIGIHGEWGSGKSTLLEEIQDKIEEKNLKNNENFKEKKESEENQIFVVPVMFNAWRFEKEEHLIIPLLKTLYYELKKLDTKTKSEKIFGEAQKIVEQTISTTLDGLKAIIYSVTEATASLDIPLVGTLEVKVDPNSGKSFMKERNEEREKEEKARNYTSKYESIYFDILEKIKALSNPSIVKESHQNISSTYALKFLFLIDDLDRCLPENTVKMLESIKLFLDIENCAFVMAVDKEIVELGVEHHYKAYREFEQELPITGNEYLEKMITLPFALPSIQKEDIRTFIKEQYSELELKENSDDILNLIIDTVPLIPRKIIRTLDLYSYKLDLVKELGMDLDKKIMLIMTLIELFIPELYRYAKKEFAKQEEQKESDVFRLIIDRRYKADNDNEDLNSISYSDNKLNEIFINFVHTRNQFNVDMLFEKILKYDNFQLTLTKYYRLEG